MERRALASRWQSEAWQPVAVVPDRPPAAPRVIAEEGARMQWLHPGFEIVLHRDEAEGYYLNVSTEDPKVFVLWREDSGGAVPLALTASYNEASRWLDGGHSVDGVPMPPEVFAWVGAFVEKHYRPEPKQRVRPRSFLHPKDRGAR